MSSEFEIKSYNTAESLASQANSEFVVYGSSDNANRFERIVIPKSGFECGIVYHYTGLKPEVLIVNQNVFIGFDETILCINQKTKQLVSENKKISLFYEFINVTSISLIVAIFELDLMALNYEGNVVWLIGFRDIVGDFNIEQNEMINITCFDGEKYKFDLLTGQYIDET